MLMSSLRQHAREAGKILGKYTGKKSTEIQKNSNILIIIYCLIYVKLEVIHPIFSDWPVFSSQGPVSPAVSPARVKAEGPAAGLGGWIGQESTVLNNCA